MRKGVIVIDSQAVPGKWFLGKAPDVRTPSYPPIVFVQGRNSSASSWNEETIYHGLNDMERIACLAGYQSVFVELYDSEGKESRSQWDNGKLLSTILKEISTYFGQKLNIIAHSKGGIDVQAALIHYDAYPYAGRVLSLSAPHKGSHLADLSYSWYASWLAELLGQKDDGTFSLQTGEMAHFRSLTDQNKNINKNTYFTAAGASRGPAFSSLSLGGAYLSSYGENDGLVNVWSTVLPYGKHLFTDQSLDHDSIRIGSRFFSKAEPFLKSTEPSSILTKGPIPEESLETEANHIIRGGPLPAGQFVKLSFSIEKEAEVTLFTMSADKETKVTLRSPSGTIIPAQKTIALPEKSYFGGAWLHPFELDHAEPGTWELSLQSPKNDAFLFIGNIHLPSPVQIILPALTIMNSKKKLLFRSQSSKKAIYSCQWRMIDRSGTLIHEFTTKAQGAAQHPLPSITKEGTYNITVDIEGTTEQGTPFTRTTVRSIYLTP